VVDTIRFQIPSSILLDNDIKSKSIETVKFSHVTHEVHYRIYTSEISLGSYNRDINLFMGKDGFWYLELSIPKFILGHNIYLYYDYKHVVRLLFTELRLKLSKHFPDFTLWKIQRIDLCYAWKYENQELAETTIRTLHTLDYDRKSKSIIDDNIMFKGSSYSVKFYLKYPEFYKHDYKILKYQGKYDFAERLLNLSNGVLRFEITMRKAALVQYFKSDVYIHHINDEFIYNRFDYYLSKLMINTNSSNYLQNKQKLCSIYGVTKAGHLLLFLNFFQTLGKKELKSLFDRKTIYRNIKLLKQANINFVSSGSSQIVFKIPSPNVVNYSDIE